MYLMVKFELQFWFQFDYSKSVICNNDFGLNIYLFRNYQSTVFFSSKALIYHNSIGYLNTFTPTVCSFAYSYLCSNHSFFINLSFYAIFFPWVTENLRLISHRISRVTPSKMITLFLYTHATFSILIGLFNWDWSMIADGKNWSVNA